jgi:diaminopimelate decarboxylase
MGPLSERDGTAWIEGVRLDEVAERYGTPTYVYSRQAIETAFRRIDAAFAAAPHLICYAVKANSNLAVLGLLARLGAGFDIVSGGELARVLAAGGDPAKVIFSGVGKRAVEIEAALVAGIKCFNVESEAELERLNHLAAARGARAPVSIRVNPNVDAGTHPYISTGLRDNKFGIPFERVLPAYRRAASLPHIEVVGIDCHIGSQILDPAPLVDAMRRVVELVDTLAAEGIALRHIDNGGGLGIPYRPGEAPPDLESYIALLRDTLGSRGHLLMIEPGRALVGAAGVLLTRVEHLKEGDGKAFCIVDASMSELIRPMLYEAWHEIVPVTPRAGVPRPYDVVGPVCESTDCLGRERMLSVTEGDLLAVLSAGAYGMVMASNYNTRPRPPEVLIDGPNAYLVRARETIASLYANESVLPAA